MAQKYNRKLIQELQTIVDSKAVEMGALNTLMDQLINLDAENDNWKPDVKASKVTAIKAAAAKAGLNTVGWSGNSDLGN